MADVYGNIGIKWRELGAAAGPLGDNVSPDEIDAPDRGRYRLFQHGIIVFHPELGTHALWGPIADTYNMGGAGSGFFPITDVSMVPRLQDGLYADIRTIADGSTWSIYWSAATGAQRTYGDIRMAWLAKRDWLGLPISDELDDPEIGWKGRQQKFERGRIRWLNGKSVYPDGSTYPPNVIFSGSIH